MMDQGNWAPMPINPTVMSRLSDPIVSIIPTMNDNVHEDLQPLQRNDQRLIESSRDLLVMYIILSQNKPKTNFPAPPHSGGVFGA